MIAVGEILRTLDSELVDYSTDVAEDTLLNGPVDWWSFNGSGLAFYVRKNPEPLKRWQGTSGSLIICHNSAHEHLFDGPFLFTDIPRSAFILCASLFLPPRSKQIHPTAIIDPKAEIGSDATIGPFAVIGAAKIGDNALIGSHVSIADNVFIGNDATIMDGARIGTDGLGSIVDMKGRLRAFPHFSDLRIGEAVVVGPNTVISRGGLSPTTIGNHCHFSNCCSIGHNSKIGNGVFCAPLVSVGGRSQLGDGCIIGHGSSINSEIIVPENTSIGTNVALNRAPTEPGQTIIGPQSKNLGRMFGFEKV
jgi:UDP-3-O-[3-hydroxymyristoyl] glucosamine N-acyltransferase